MNEIERIGVDLGKRVFHVTVADAKGGIVERKPLRRSGLQSYLAKLAAGCKVAMEACGSAHHWGRLAARLGHRALPTSPQLVSPYVKSNKNDANDADGIAEAACRPTMRFVGVKDVGPARQEPALDKGLRDRRLVEAGGRGTHQCPGAFASVERPNICQQLTLSRQSPTTRSLQTRGGPYMSNEKRVSVLQVSV